MKSLSLSAILALVLTALASIAVASPGKGHNRFLGFFDDNRDGLVTRDEFNASAAKRYARMDTDGNNQLTQEEFRDYIRQRAQERRAARRERIDSNQDGQISRDEYLSYKRQHAERRFERMDKDGDGAIEADEYSKPHHMRFSGRRIFHRLDGDSDGRVTREESLKAWSGWFDRIDANKDGVVSGDELEAYREHKRPH